MDPFLFRIIRSIVMALIMFFSCIGLGLNGGASILAASIPLLLGIIDVAAPTMFSLTAVIMVLAVVVHIFPEPFKAIKNVVSTQFAGSHLALKSSSQGAESSTLGGVAAEKK